MATVKITAEQEERKFINIFLLPKLFPNLKEKLTDGDSVTYLFSCNRKEYGIHRHGGDKKHCRIKDKGCLNCGQPLLKNDSIIGVYELSVGSTFSPECSTFHLECFPLEDIDRETILMT